MKPLYRWSALNHVFTKNNVHAILNALKLKPLYVDTSLLEALQLFAAGATAEDIIAQVPGELQQKLIKLVPIAIEAKILIKADISDAEILDFFRDNYLGKPYISIAYFILTDACNFGCKYCFVENRMPTAHTFQRMSVDTVKRGLDFFCRQIQLKPGLFEKEKTIVIYGGEPLLNMPALKALLEEVDQRKTNGCLPEKTELSMVTNAALVTEDVADLLAKHKVNVAVSIDGDKDATNSARQYKDGTGVYDNVIKGYRLLCERGANTGISCTLNQQSVDNFDATLDTLLNQLGVASLGFNLVLPSKEYPVPADYDEKASQAIILAFKKFRELGIFEDRIMRKVDAFVKGEIHAFDCGASGGGQIVIAPNGQVGICHGYLGNRKYFPTTVYDLIFDPEKNSTFKEWSFRSPLSMSQCQKCPALGICGGGCPLNAEFEHGSIWELDQRFCVHTKASLEWLIWDLYEQITK